MSFLSLRLFLVNIISFWIHTEVICSLTNKSLDYSLLPNINTFMNLTNHYSFSTESKENKIKGFRKRKTIFKASKDYIFNAEMNQSINKRNIQNVASELQVDANRNLVKNTKLNSIRNFNLTKEILPLSNETYQPKKLSYKVYELQLIKVNYLFHLFLGFVCFVFLGV